MSEFDTSYRNLPDFRLLRTFPPSSHRLKWNAVDHPIYDVSARVWRTNQFDPDDPMLLILRVWLPSGHCAHLALDEVGTVLATGYERREGKSWEQTLSSLVAKGVVVV